jgi:hypothetical protein
VLTSGATETVPDVSEFANQLKLALKRNESRYLDALMLFNEIRLGIDSTIPLLGGLQGTGHQEGASFLLFLKEGVETYGPAETLTSRKQEQFFSVGAGFGLMLPVDGYDVLKPGPNPLAYLYYNLTFDWGIMGIGLQTGFMKLTTRESAVDDYDMISVPMAISLRYATVFDSPVYLFFDLSAGSMISRFQFFGGNTETVTVAKPFITPTLGVGLQLFDQWRIAAFGSYVAIFFNDSYFDGISPGVRLEYSL